MNESQRARWNEAIDQAFAKHLPAPQMITPTQHDKNEWSRMATAAYAIGLNSVGHTYSVAASLPHAGRLTLAYFDKLQDGYRAWLVFNEWPA